MLISGQRDFARALLAPGAGAPGGLSTWNGSDPAQRFAVYRNNVVVSLIEALAAAYPVVRQLVGEVFFREMARTYVGLHPPRSRIMLGYGERFPEFIETFVPAAGLPYLPDVARLEGARRRAYHAADDVALEPTAYAALDPEALGGMIVMLHPSVTILRSPFAIVSLWAAHQGLLAIESVDPDQSEDVLVVRPALDVEVVPLPPGVAGFLESLAGGATVMDALARALDEMPAFDITDALATLMSSRAAVTFKPSGE